MSAPGPVVAMRVLEVGRRLGVAAAGLVLTALGGEVVQVPLPGRRVSDDDARYYDRGRTVVAPDADLVALAAAAEVVLTDLADDDWDELGLSLPTATATTSLVTIRSLGAHGPNAHYRMTDLTEWAAGGLANVTRRPYLDDPERYVPVLPPGAQPQALAGLAAASGALAARRWARAGAEPVVVDVSVQEVMAATVHSTFPHFVWNGLVLGHPASPMPSLGVMLPAVDGDVYIRAVEAHQWDKLMAWVGNPEWGVLGATSDDRLANQVALRGLLSEWTASQRRDDLVEEGQRRKVPIALPRTLTDVLAWQQLRARGAWTTLEVEGAAVEVPRIPLFEPPCWAPARSASAAAVLASWAPA